MKSMFKIIAIATLAVATATAHAGPVRPHSFYTSDSRFHKCIKQHIAQERIMGQRTYYATGQFLDWRWAADADGRIMKLERIGDGHKGQDMETSSWLRDAMWGCSPTGVKPNEEGVISWQIKLDEPAK